MKRGLVVVLFVAGLGTATGLCVSVPAGPWRSRPAEGGTTGITRTVQSRAITTRQGTYYLPSGYESRSLPLMVAFHGTGGKGSLMALRLQPLAEREGFIVLAPDSVSVAGVWSVAQRPDDVTEDFGHVMRCVQEVLHAPGVQVDRARVLAAGFSVGSSVAPYVATREKVFTAFAVLHGHVSPAAWGPLRPRAWVSAGDRDRVRSVQHMKSVADHLRQQGFPSVEFRIFPVDHTLGDAELAALVAWWLRGARAGPEQGAVRRVEKRSNLLQHVGHAASGGPLAG